MTSATESALLFVAVSNLLGLALMAAALGFVMLAMWTEEAVQWSPDGSTGLTWDRAASTAGTPSRDAPSTPQTAISREVTYP